MAMYKKFIRSLMRDKLKGLSEMEKSKKDEIIFSKLINHIGYKNSKNIFVFVSYKKEVDTHKLIRDALARGKTVAVPVILSLKEGMIAVIINDLDELKENKFGILEPTLIENRIMSPEEIDLVIVPGAAFDKECGRIGYGAGMYDKYLVNLRSGVQKIAVGYDFQLLERVPMEAQDIRVDEVITD
jgi:5-formyltetrahydrofolate cyclo-ligase